MNTFFDENNEPTLNVSTKNLVGLGITALVIFGAVYLVGRAWKKSQTV